MAEILDPGAEPTETAETPQAVDTTTPEVEEVPDAPDSEEREAGSDDTDRTPGDFFGDHLADLVSKGTIDDAALAEIAEAQGVTLRQAQLERDSVLLQRTQVIGQIHDAAGGSAEWESIKAWANSELSDLNEADSERIASTLQLGGNAALSAVHELRARFDRQKSKPGPKPKKAAGTAPKAPSAKPFANWSEAMTAMGGANDMKYRTDPAYRADIDKRLAVSDL